MDATLTLGNKKSVDIVVVQKTGDAVTIDVKGVAGKYDWPADNIRPTLNLRHFIALVSYEGKFEDPSSSPKIWIVPAEQILKFKKQYKTRSDISRALIRKNGDIYQNAWELLKTD